MIVFRWRISDFFIFALQAFLAWLGPAWLWESSREPQKAIGHDPGIPKNSPTSQHVYCIIVSEIKQSLAPTARKRWYFPAIFVNTKFFLWSSCIIFYDSWVCNFFFIFSFPFNQVLFRCGNKFCFAPYVPCKTGRRYQVNLSHVMFQNIPPSATVYNNGNMCIQNISPTLTPKMNTSILPKFCP